MEEIFDADDVEDVLELEDYCVSPDEYFKGDTYDNRLLTLDDIRDYEIHLKRGLYYLKDLVPKSIETIY